MSNIKFKKKFGQNFIFDTNLLKAIVNDAKINNKIQVLEIGTGAATLTREIAHVAKQVYSFEIDEGLKPEILKNLKGVTNVEVFFKDFLKANLNEIEEKLNEYKVVANLPYYITSPIIFKFIEESQKVQSLTIMVQKEVADRIVARAGTKDYGIITVLISAIANVKLTRTVNRKMFTPAPNVDSAVVNIEFNRNKFLIDDFKLFSKIVKTCFAMRRKTLINNLKVLNIAQNEVEKMFKILNLPVNIRGEALNVEQFVELYKLIKATK